VLITCCTVADAGVVECVRAYENVSLCRYQNWRRLSVAMLTATQQTKCISNDSSFRLKHPGVPDGSDGSGGTSYPLTENQTQRVAQATGRIAYLPCGGYYTMPLILATGRVVYYTRRSGVRLPLLYVRNVVTYTHHQNDTYVTLFAGVAVMQ